MKTNNPCKCFFFDTETVTLDSTPDSCTFFQLSGIIEIDGVEMERFNFLMNPNHTCEYNPECLTFNKITEEDLEKYPLHEEIYQKLINIFDKYINKFDKNDKFHCVGYNNLKFDQDKLWNWFALMDKINGSKYNTFGSYCWTNAIDVFPMLSLIFIKYRNLFTNFKLATVATKLSQMGLIDSKYQNDNKWHSADCDIEATRDLFYFCLKMFQFDPFKN